MTAASGFCVACGAPRGPDDRFCRSCGRAADLAASPDASAPTPTAVAAPPAGPTQEPDHSGATGGMGALDLRSQTAGGRGASATGGPVPGPGSQPPGRVPWTTPPRRLPRGSGTRPKFGRSIRDGMSSTMRGCLGCFGLLVALGALGAILANPSGGGTEPSRTPRSTFSAPSAVRPTGFLPTVDPNATPEPIGTVEPSSRVVRISLPEALSKDLVSMEAQGLNLQELSIDLESLADEPLQVVAYAGLVFDPAASSTQQMVVISATEFELEPGGTASEILDVACAAMHLDQPGSGDSFTVSTAASTAALRAIVRAPGFADADFRVQQFAIWTVTDNPTRSGFVGLGVGGVGSGPDDDEIAQIRALFVDAGLDPSRYRALR